EELALLAKDEAMQAGLGAIRQGAKAGSRQAQVGDRLIGAAVGVGADVRLGDPGAAIEEAGRPGVTLAGVDAHGVMVRADRPATGTRSRLRRITPSAVPAPMRSCGRSGSSRTTRVAPLDALPRACSSRSNTPGGCGPRTTRGWLLEEAGRRLPTIGEQRHLDRRP